MKKTFALFLIGFLVFSCSVEASNYRRDIKNNERKINQIKSSKNLSDYYKKREIRRLEKQNYYLKKIR